MHIIQDGQFISQDVQRVVMALKEYEPNLEVTWLPPAAREEGQAAFRILFHRPDGRTETLFHVKTEAEFDMRVLMRVIQNDQRYGEVKLSEYEAWEKSQKLLAEQEWLDKLEADTDLAYHVFKSHKNTYKVRDDLVFKDNVPFNAAKLRN